MTLLGGHSKLKTSVFPVQLLDPPPWITLFVHFITQRNSDKSLYDSFFSSWKWWVLDIIDALAAFVSDQNNGDIKCSPKLPRHSLTFTSVRKKEQLLKANSSLLILCGPINKERYMACTAPKSQHYIWLLVGEFSQIPPTGHLATAQVLDTTLDTRYFLCQVHLLSLLSWHNWRDW